MINRSKHLRHVAEGERIRVLSQRQKLEHLQADCDRLTKTRLLHHNEAAARDLALKHLQIKAEIALARERQEQDIEQAEIGYAQFKGEVESDGT